LTGPSTSGGAFNQFLDRVNESDRSAADRSWLRSTNGFPTNLDAEAAARPAAAAARSSDAIRPSADVTPLPQRVGNLRAADPSSSPSAKVLATADDDAGDKFLDELEAWVRASATQAKPAR
jgi:hypothetical protein